MSIKFFAQKIFNSQDECIGAELLVREIPYESKIIKNPLEIMSHPDFNEAELFNIDMQVLTFLDIFSTDFKKTGLKYVFINLSDEILKRLIIGSNSNPSFNRLKSVCMALKPLSIVIEISESSRVRKEHLALIVERLRGIGFLFAQDDYTPERINFLTLEWDFIKIDFDSCNECDIPANHRIVIERSDLATHDKYQGNTLHQGFVFHHPDELSKVLNELKTENAKKKSGRDDIVHLAANSR